MLDENEEDGKLHYDGCCCQYVGSTAVHDIELNCLPIQAVLLVGVFWWLYGTEMKHFLRTPTCIRA